MRWLTKYFKFWAFAVVSVLATLWLGFEIVGFSPFDDRYGLTASFEDATGLRAGDPVRLSGVPVGQVGSVRLESGHAVVDFAVDSDVDLPVDSTVAVRARNIIGQRELLLTPGTASKMYADLDRDDRTFDPANTDDAVELGNLVNELGPLLEAVDPEKLNELSRVLTETLAGNREPIQNITSDLSTVVAQLAERRDTIAQLIDDYQVIVGEVGRRDLQIQQLIDNIVLLTETFNASEDVLVQALDELPGFADRLAVLLSTNAGNLDSILRDLALVTDTVSANVDKVATFAETAPASLRGLITVSGRGDFLALNAICVQDRPPPCQHPLTESGSSDVDEIIAEILGFLP